MNAGVLEEIQSHLDAAGHDAADSKHALRKSQKDDSRFEGFRDQYVCRQKTRANLDAGDNPFVEIVGGE